MENQNNIDTHLPEEIVTEIIARLSLRSISRFKLVCRTWKSTLESLYFRRRFVSLHQNMSISWSLLCGGREFINFRGCGRRRFINFHGCGQREFINFHGCQTWGVPKSLGSYVLNIEISGNLPYVNSSNGLVLINGYIGVAYVGNPVLKQWVVVPSPPYQSTMLSALVTCVDEDGVVLSFKVVRTAAVIPSEDRTSTSLCFCVYSSETGIWTYKRLHCPHYFNYSASLLTLHGMLYISPSGFNERFVTGVLIAHDFYSESNVCRVIPLPDNDSNNDRFFKRALTTSTGFVMYIKTLANNVLKVWRLLNNDDDDDDSAWELLWETNLVFIPCDDNIIFYAPFTMHPFDHNIVYLWNIRNRYLVSCNLETQNYHIFIDQSVDDDLQNCFVNHSLCDEYMDGMFQSCVDGYCGISVARFQYVLPRWMGSIPRPPKAEILDTTSLLSFSTSRIALNMEKMKKSRSVK